MTKEFNRQAFEAKFLAIKKDSRKSKHQLILRTKGMLHHVNMLINEQGETEDLMAMKQMLQANCQTNPGGAV